MLLGELSMQLVTGLFDDPNIKGKWYDEQHVVRDGGHGKDEQG